MSLTSNDDNSAVLPVHTPEEQKHQQPVAEVIRREGDVDALALAILVVATLIQPHPLLLAKVLEARVQHERPDGREVARGDARVDGGCGVADAARRGQVDGEDVVGLRGQVFSSEECQEQLMTCPGGGGGGGADRVEPVVLGGDLGGRGDVARDGAAEASVCARYYRCNEGVLVSISRVMMWETDTRACLS